MKAGQGWSPQSLSRGGQDKCSGLPLALNCCELRTEFPEKISQSQDQTVFKITSMQLTWAILQGPDLEAKVKGTEDLQNGNGFPLFS